MFKMGQVVVFEPKNFNPEYWNNLPEADRINYYGALGYGRAKPLLFSYLCQILSEDGDTSHCILVSLEDGHLEVMRHDSDFRMARDDEF